MDRQASEINHEGTVTVISGDTVTVSISSSSACSGCHAKGSCSMLGSEEKFIEIQGRYNVKPGDNVNVVMMQSMGFRALVLGYLLPFLIMIITLFALISLNFPELTAGLFALSVLAPYYLILYLFRRRINEKFTFSLKV